MNKIRLEGLITAEEVLSTTFPISTNEAIQDFELKRHVDGYLKRGTMPIMRGGKISEEPIISATASKSRLRHECADAIIQARSNAGKKVSLKDLYRMKVGQDADAKSNKKKLESGESTLIDIGEINQVREQDPCADQFGVFHIEGNIQVSIGLPVIKTDLVYLGGVRRDIPVEFIDEFGADGAKEEYAQRRVNNTLLSHSKTDLSDKQRELKVMRTAAGLKKGAENAESIKLKAEIEEIKARQADLVGLQGDTANSTQMPIPVRTCAPVGAQFKQNITIADGSVRGLSMVAFGLNGLSKNPKIGAYKSLGGEISAIYIVKLITDGVSKTMGKLTVGGFVNAEFKGVDEEAQAWWNKNALNTDWIK